MKKCKTCNITYNTDRYTCPFCRNILEETNKIEHPTVYQSYPKFKDKIRKINLTQRIFIFLTLIATVIITIINYYQFKQGTHSLWSIITILGILTLWSLIKGIIISKKNSATRIFIFGLCLILLILSIEYLSIPKETYSNWSINYVIPFLLISTLSAINILIILRKKCFSSYIGYALWTSILLISYHLLYIFNITSILWTSIACLGYGFATILALFLFGGKTTIQEIKKRLTL